MKEIPLTRGKVAIVDDDDYAELSNYKWYYDSKGYAARHKTRDQKRAYQSMHRQIVNAPDGMEVDHINGDRLDNRRANLRLCTRSQNQHNKGAQANNTSGFKGVQFYKRTGKWHAKIKLHGKERHLGYFATAAQAAEAYNRAAFEIHGDFAYLNAVE